MFNSLSISALIDKYHEGKLAHAFLLETNNTKLCFDDIMLLIKNINCPFDYSDSCEKECNLCNLIDTDNLPSLINIEPEGQFIKKAQILDMMNKFSTKPVYSKFNIYIIKDADRFNASSANTILKFLEEPEDNILGFFITNNKENVISTIRSRCQSINVKYKIDNVELDEDVLLDVKLYLNSIYKNTDDLLYNRTHMSDLYSERILWEKFFNTMLYYFEECVKNNRKDLIDVIKSNSFEMNIKIILLIKNILGYIKSNGNIDLILDKFVIEMRDLYE